MPPENDWNEWSKYVLKELERLGNSYEKLDARMDKMSNEITSLKVKSGVWGLIGGAIPVAIGIGVWLIRTL